MYIFFFQFLMLMTSPLNYPCAEFSIKCYPDTVNVGDSFYVLVSASNPYDHPIGIPTHFTCLYPGGVSIRMSLTNSKNKTIPLFFEDTFFQHVSRVITFVAIPPHENRLIGILTITVPPLEYLYGLQFWRDTLKNLPSDASINLTIETWIPHKTWNQELENDLSYVCGYEERSIVFHRKIYLNLRPQKEMEMIDQWYQNSSNNDFPILGHEQLPSHKVPSYGFLAYDRPPWCFINVGNRYPGPPNHPTTWQGWRELEESITPSTMRDEIRLTRILIQYCDTRDAKVLSELKEWFTGMNEVQRVCMAKSIRDRARGCYGTDLLAPFRELYKTIREYDIAAKSDREMEWLKKLRLLE
jgi:hypothetical protein